MEIYTLNDRFVPTDIIDDHKSMVWSERFNEVGDFQLTIPMYNSGASKLSIGTWLGLDVSDRIMRVDTIETTQDEDGTQLLDIRGESIEGILKKRVYWRSSAGSSVTTPYRRNGGVVSVLLNTLRLAGLVPGVTNWTPLVSTITVPRTVTTNLYPPDNITDPGSLIVVTDRPLPVYDFMVDICKSYNVGFRFYRNRETNDGNLYVNVYLGSNRVSNQTARDHVVFAPSLDNIQSQSVIETNKDSTIGVWVWDSAGARTAVFYPDYGPAAPSTGLDLSIDTIMVEPPDGATTTERTEHRLSVGVEHLNTHGQKIVIDGEVSNASLYTYGVDYFLGDRVEVQTLTGPSEHTRVTEYIFVSDETGDHSYPTLTTELVVNQDSWLGQPTNLHWAQAQGSWSEQ